MGGIADHHALPPLRLGLPDEALNPADLGAGGVQNLGPPDGKGLVHLPAHAVGPQEHRVPGLRLLRGGDDSEAQGGEAPKQNPALLAAITSIRPPR